MGRPSYVTKIEKSREFCFSDSSMPSIPLSTVASLRYLVRTQSITTNKFFDQSVLVHLGGNSKPCVEVECARRVFIKHGWEKGKFLKSIFQVIFKNFMDKNNLQIIFEWNSTGYISFHMLFEYMYISRMFFFSSEYHMEWS